jgi:DEAD/DEAH box helicase
MAKKKKAASKQRNDARGYGQATPVPASAVAEPPPSSQEQLQQQHQGTTTIATTSKHDDDDSSKTPTSSLQNLEEEVDDATRRQSARMTPSSSFQKQHQNQNQPSSSILQSAASASIRKVPAKLVIPPGAVALATSAPAAMIMTASVQDCLEAVLQDLQQHHSLYHHHHQVTTSLFPSDISSMASDRFEKRLAGVYDHLVHYGFALQPQIHQVVAVLGHDITVTRALDWLCLHLDSTELPPLFTEGQVRESLLKQQQQQSNSSSSFTPNVWIAPALVLAVDDSALDRQSPEPPTTPDHAAEANEGTGDDDDDDAHTDTADDEQGDDAIYQAAEKGRILEMYQYEEQDHKKGNEESVQQPQHPQELLLPDGERLKAAEQELAMARADAQDEASNYMRSKYEIKQLQKRVQQLQKHVSGLQRKASQAREAATAAAAATTAATTIAQNEENMEMQQQEQAETLQQKDRAGNDDDCNDDDSGGLFGMFGVDDTATADISTGDKEKSQSDTNQDLSSNSYTNDDNSDTNIVVPEDAIPKSWTGKTPKEVLEDWCRKQKLPRPTFTKQPQNGCLVRVKLNANNNGTSSSDNDIVVEVQQQGPIHNFVDAQHYTATKVLYQINPHLPLYRLFPPAYRDLWKSWTLQVQTEKEQSNMVKDQARRAILDQLLQLIPSTTTKSSVSSSSMATIAAKAKSSQINNGGDEDICMDEADALDDYVTENWEDQGEKVVSHTIIQPSSSNSTKKKSKLEEGFYRLKQTFRDRQATPRYQNMYKQRCTLPIYAYRDEILDSVSKNPVTVLCAETGAGKTTQCPQFLLEHALQSGGGGGKDPTDDYSAAKTCILVSQPRRIAATSVAERVAEEMCERSVGNLVGYQIRLEAKRTAQTRLLFCTTGVVLRRLIEDPNLSSVSHVVVDEVSLYTNHCIVVAEQTYTY